MRRHLRRFKSELFRLITSRLLDRPVANVVTDHPHAGSSPSHAGGLLATSLRLVNEVRKLLGSAKAVEVPSEINVRRWP
ncbi:hypothetical protein MES4922_130102 [Mesorhizobium ventifaucium]|uniref:Uncharacterized protein n=1 Tax=Mesorhizobium ventifaucium TaxID=666020 RepID=A0ABN8JE44_9HYPH|nr:hypothetical protein MES4922_130102 [Mesorhizobium ventifaucium]